MLYATKFTIFKSFEMDRYLYKTQSCETKIDKRIGLILTFKRAIRKHRETLRDWNKYHWQCHWNSLCQWFWRSKIRTLRQNGLVYKVTFSEQELLTFWISLCSKYWTQEQFKLCKFLAHPFFVNLDSHDLPGVCWLKLRFYAGFELFFH